MKSIGRLLSALSIRRKLLWVIMAASMITLLLTCAFFIAYNIIDTRSRMAQELNLLAKVIGSRSTAALTFSDNQMANENLAALGEKKAIISACIYDVGGKPFATYKRQGGGGIACPPHQDIQGHDFTADDLSLRENIVLDGEVVGSIYIRSDLGELKEQITRYTTYVLAFMLLGWLVAYSLSFTLRSIISAPIMHLVQTVKEISHDKNYTIRAQKTTKDELGTLVDSFNDMVTQIYDRDIALQKAKEDLELRVVERTQDLEIAKEQAEKANEAKSQFLANMSHELRTPMHAILSYASFGMDEINDAPKEEIYKYFQRVHDSGSRLLALLNNLLDLSKLEAGKMQYDMQKGDLEKPVSVVARELQMLLDEKGLQLEIVKDKTVDTHVMFDSSRVVQVVYNLLSNAIKFSPAKSKTTVSFEEVEFASKAGEKLQGVAVKVSDEGIGIPENELEAVFDKFIQSSKTHTGAGGTGLGLAICREIVHEHGGRIWAQNNPEKGATFTFVIPRSIRHNEPSRDAVKEELAA